MLRALERLVAAAGDLDGQDGSRRVAQRDEPAQLRLVAAVARLVWLQRAVMDACEAGLGDDEGALLRGRFLRRPRRFVRGVGGPAGDDGEPEAMAVLLVAVASQTPGARAPSRSARSRTWGRDSSPDT